MTPALRAILFGQRPWSYMDWFRSSEQGAVYEADNPADGGPVTAYVENTGITPVTAPGQGAADCVVGLLLDKRLGLVRGAEFFADANVVLIGEATRVSAGVYRILSTAGVSAGISITGAAPLVVGRFYEVTFTVDSIAVLGAGVQVDAGGAAFTTTGTKTTRFVATSTSAVIKRTSSACDIQISSVSFRELPGNHATQATTASKPVLTARYNLLRYTEQFDNALWSKTTGVTVPATTETAPDGTATADRIVYDGSGAAGGVRFSQNTSAIQANGAGVITSVWLKASAPVTLRIGDNRAYSTINVTTAWQRFSITTTWDGVSNLIPLVSSPVADNTAFTLYAWGADCRTSADAALSIPAYQRVTDASNYDTSGFPCFLRFDGFDDSLSTAAIDFTATDKMTAVAGVTKLSDAAAGVVCELSATISANNGSFFLVAPAAANASYGFASKGTAQATASSISAAFAAPHAAAVAGAADIAGDSTSLRVNGAVASTSAGDQGTGNFGSHVLNIGRRNNTNLPFSGRITSLIVRGAATNDAQIVKAERYVARKMKVTL
jgi:hypothetical protein